MKWNAACRLFVFFIVSNVINGILRGDVIGHLRTTQMMMV